MATYIYVGAQFENFESLEHCIKEYEKENHLCFYKRDVRTIQSASRKIPRVLKTDEKREQLKYYFIKYACIFGGRTHVKRLSKTPGGKRRQATSFRQNCPAYIKVLLGKDQNCLSIVALNTEHNHVISEELFKKLPRQRKLAKEEEEKVTQLLKLKVNKKLLLQQIVQETGKQVTRRDLFNIAVRNSKTKEEEPLIANQIAVASTVEVHTGNVQEASNPVSTYVPVTDSTQVEHYINNGAVLSEIGIIQDDHIYGIETASEKVAEMPHVESYTETQRVEKQSKLDFIKEVEMKKLKIKEEKLRLKSEKIRLLEEQNELLRQIIYKI